MTLKEFFEQANEDYTYAVKLAYRHLPSEEYHVSIEVCEYGIGYGHIGWTWFNDWYEGQKDVVVLDCIALEDVFNYKTDDRPTLIYNGMKIYLTEDHINALKEYEQKQMLEDIIDRMMKNIDELRGDEK